MTVVVDLGCHTHPDYPADESINALLEKYRPTVLYGFDPHPDTATGVWSVNGSSVSVARIAAWTWDGEVRYNPRTDRPLVASVGAGPAVVPCFDLARLLRGWQVVLKLDVEGAEYPLLEHLIARDATRFVSELLVEWHAPPIGPADWEERRDAILAALTCPVSEW